MKATSENMRERAARLRAKRILRWSDLHRAAEAYWLLAEADFLRRGRIDPGYNQYGVICYAFDALEGHRKRLRLHAHSTAQEVAAAIDGPIYDAKGRVVEPGNLPEVMS